jgi:hypothetical protein
MGNKLWELTLDLLGKFLNSPSELQIIRDQYVLSSA